jgi:hypothetical protein
MTFDRFLHNLWNIRMIKRNEFYPDDKGTGVMQNLYGRGKRDTNS